MLRSQIIQHLALVSYKMSRPLRTLAYTQFSAARAKNFLSCLANSELVISFTEQLGLILTNSPSKCLNWCGTATAWLLISYVLRWALGLVLSLTLCIVVIDSYIKLPNICLGSFSFSILDFSAFFTLMSACAPIHASLCYGAFGPQLVQACMNGLTCRHKSKKCHFLYFINLTAHFQLENEYLTAKNF